MTHDELMQKRANSLAGRSPTQVGREKTHQALDWVYRWGWSSAAVLDGLSGAKRRGLAARLVKRGLLRATRTRSGGALQGVPIFILTLTPLGLIEVEHLRDSTLDYKLDPYRYNQSLLRHDLLAQEKTLAALRQGKISDFLTEAEFAKRSMPGHKQPDVIWLFHDNKRSGIEIELSAKWGRGLDQFVSACVRALLPGPDSHCPLEHIGIFTDSEAIKRRYQAALRVGACYTEWQKDAQGKWVKAGNHEVPPELAGRVICRLVAQ